MAIGIAGAGRVGQALGRLLCDAGWPVVALASRSRANGARGAAFVGSGVRALGYEELPGWCDRILIAVPDDAIKTVVASLREGGFGHGLVLHTSGYHGTGVLNSLAAAGASCASLHPLQTVPDARTGLEALRGCVFGLSGHGEAANWGREIAQSLGGRVVLIDEAAKPLYHAAAVIGCNYLVLLADAAVKVLQSVGLDQPEVRAGLFRMMEETLSNVSDRTAAEALTGPLARGDVETVKGHLSALSNSGLEEVAALYRALGLFGLALAGARGVDPGRLKELEHALGDGTLAKSQERHRKLSR